MKRYTWVATVKLVLSVIFLVGCVSAALTARDKAPCSLSAEVADGVCRCGKIGHEQSGAATCSPPAIAQGADSLELADPFRFVLEKDEPANRRIGVSALVQRALRDQQTMLRAKQAELQRWNQSDRAVFAKWFGTTRQDARQMIHQRVLRVLELNKNYSARNFRRANPPRPNVYPYVYASRPDRVYLDQLFVGQAPAGENSRAGTITHEMSHFTIIGGTKDHTYGPANCKTLARNSSSKALNNADNFEYWAEGAR